MEVGQGPNWGCSAKEIKTVPNDFCIPHWRKVKVKLSLCLIKHYGIEYGGSGSMTPCIFNLATSGLHTRAALTGGSTPPPPVSIRLEPG
jgi:hypothetical protein